MAMLVDCQISLVLFKYSPSRQCRKTLDFATLPSCKAKFTAGGKPGYPEYKGTAAITVSKNRTKIRATRTLLLRDR
jgi:hypothetical protein